MEERRRLWIALGGSTLAHLALFALGVRMPWPMPLHLVRVFPVSLVGFPGVGANGGGGPAAVAATPPADTPPALPPSPPRAVATRPPPPAPTRVARPTPLRPPVVPTRTAATPPPAPEPALAGSSGGAPPASDVAAGGGPGGGPGGGGQGSGPGSGEGDGGARVAYGTNPHPQYPLAYQRLGMEGVVELDVIVAPDGRPLSVRVGRSCGYPQLDELAVDTVRTSWRFVPARRAGVPIEGRVTVPIRFKLGDARG